MIEVLVCKYSGKINNGFIDVGRMPWRPPEG
jgi:hypothetical protein